MVITSSSTMPRQSSTAVQGVGASSSKFVQDIKIAFASAKENILSESKWIKQELAGIFRKTRVVAETEAPKVSQALSVNLSKANLKIVRDATAAYNSGASKIAGNIVMALDRGISATVAKGIIAGKKLADSVIAGTQLSQGIGLSQRFNNAKAGMASAIDDKMSGATSGNLAKVGVAASSAVFALSMIPGPAGQVAQTLLPIVSIGSMLAPMFTGLATATGMTIGTMVVAALPFVAAAAAIALVVGGIVVANNAYLDAKKKELAAINNTADAYKNSKGAPQMQSKVL
jgi:hypothetical protein